MLLQKVNGGVSLPHSHVDTSLWPECLQPEGFFVDEHCVVPVPWRSNQLTTASSMTQSCSAQ